MNLVAGIPLVTLFDLSDRANEALPASVSALAERFSVIDLKSRTSDDAVIHSGQLLPIFAVAGEDIEEIDLSFGKLKIPLLTTGVPFRLAMRRVAVSNTLEPGSDTWQLDLVLGEFSLELDGLKAAEYRPEQGTVPRHLAPLPSGENAAIVGSCAIRFEKPGPGQDVVFRFIDAVGGGDPFVPDARSGAVTNITMSPPHALIGDSNFGITVKNLLFDYSTTFSPAFVLAQGQSAEWVGLAIEEAAIYWPDNALGKGGFSISVKDLLLGDPFGIQGELELQFGQTPLDPATFVFQQEGEPNPSGFDAAAGIVEIKAAGDDPVRLSVSLTVGAPPDGGAITDFKAKFVFPGGAETTGDAASGLVRHDDLITITPIEVTGTAPNEVERNMPSFTVRVVSSGTPARIDATINATAVPNLVDVSGPASEITGLVLSAQLDPPEAGVVFRWEAAGLGIDEQGSTLTLDLPADASGAHFLKLTRTDGEGGATHLRIRLRDEGSGPLYFGCEAGLFAASAPGTAVAPTRLMGTYDLTQFHAEGRLGGASGGATFAGTTLTIDPGVIAEFALEEGGASAITDEDRHVQVLYRFDQSDPQEWGDVVPFAGRSSDAHEGLLKWAANYSGATFVVIGRCDDVGSDAYNVGLAERRRDAIIADLTTARGDGVAVTSPIVGFQEQNLSGLDSATRAVIEAEAEDEGVPISQRALWHTSGRLINDLGVSTSYPIRPDGSGERSSPPDPIREGEREAFRRVDVYAVGGTASGTSVRTTTDAVTPRTRQLLAPAPGRDTLPAENTNAAADYRVLIRMGWDKPRWDGPATLIPNLAEFEYAWTPSEAEDGISTTAEVLTVFGKYVHDDLTGFTEFTAGIKSEGDPDGLFDTQQPNLVAFCTFGPMLLSGVDFSANEVESGVRLGALALITGFAGADFGDGPLIGPESKSAFTKVQAKARTRAISNPLDSFKIEVLTDYSNTVHVNAGALGLKTDPDQPMKIKYKDVGVFFDNTDPDAPLIDRIGVAYASDSMSVEDSGLWLIEGPLGRLLRITEFKMGTGSLWFEPTLALGIDIGVVEVSEASFRVTFNVDSNGDLNGGPEFSLRGLEASVNIPAVVTGEGRIKIEDGGILRAGVDATLIPLQARASVALAVGIPDNPPDFAPSLFLSLYGRVQFPGGIPLGPLPFAIHGFIGQVTINGARAVEDTTDVVKREIGWWRKDPEDKYDPKKGQYAFGVGVVVGTLPDASFSFSATGMVVVAFPDVEVIFGVEVEILSIPAYTANDKKEGESAAITGLVVINSDAVTVAVSATYEIPKLLKLTVPFGAHFPSSGASYVRIGSDNGPNRTGEPVTLVILPETLDLRAWCFMMVEGGGLLSFGPSYSWDFHGFALGFGAGIDLEWKAGPFELNVNGAVYAGMGTAPLMIKAGAYLRGNLDLVVVSASVSGTIEVTYIDLPDAPAEAAIENAEFCAEVDLFFFSVGGCVSFEFGGIGGFIPPPPPPPVQSLTLSDRANAITGHAIADSIPQARAIYDFVEVDGVTTNQGAKPEDNHTVWPDTVPVLNFSHAVEDAISGQFDPIAQPAGEIWFGSNRLRYAYKIIDVRLLHDGDDTEVIDPGGDPLRSIWTHPPSRPADDSSTLPPSGAEATSLRLLDRDPAAWAQSTAEGGAGQPGDPAEIIRRICEEGDPPARACLLGQHVSRVSSTKVDLRRLTPPPGPYPSGFLGEAEARAELGGQVLTGTQLLTVAASLGLVVEPGRYRSVPSTALATGTATFGYTLPHLRSYDPNGPGTRTQIPWRITLDRDVRDGALTLMVCEPREAGPGEGCYDFAGQKIGTKAERLDLPPFVVTATPTAARPNTLEITDSVQAIGQGGWRNGVDSRPELTLTNPGGMFQLKRPCHELIFTLWLPSAGDLKATALHADGSTSNQVVETRDQQPATMTFTSGSGITHVRFELGGYKQVVVLEVCCTKPGALPPDTRRDCISFDRLNRDLVNDPSFTLDSATFSVLDSQSRMDVRDAVDEGADPERAGQDGRLDLRFPSAGIRVGLAAPCRQLEVSVLAVSPVTITGFNVDGKEVTSVATQVSAQFGQTLVLNGASDPIAYFELKGGSSESFLYRVCCVRGIDPGTSSRCWDLDDLPRDVVGKRTLTLDGLQVIPNGRGVMLADQLDTVGTPKEGRDGRFELLLPDRGVVVNLPSGCTDIDIYVLLQGNADIKATGLNADGDPVAQASAPSQNQIEVLRLVAKEPMRRILIEGGAGEAVLFRICCRAGDLSTPANRCISMEKAPSDDKVAKFELEGLVFSDPKGEESLSARKATDATPAILLLPQGLRVDLPRLASFVQLKVMAKEGASYEARAFDASGQEVGGEGAKVTSQTLSIALRGEAIARVELQVESGAGLIDICLRETGLTDRRVPTRAVNPVALRTDASTKANRWPTVTGRNDENESADWKVERLSSHPRETGGTCHILRYTPPAIGPEAVKVIDVQTAQGGSKEVTFIGLCAVDNKAAQWHAIDEVVKDELTDDLNDRDPIAGRAVVLDPGTTYRVEVDWEYQDFQSESETEQPPSVPPSGGWKTGGTQIFRFATAPENAALPALQDGPNEHIFDPRDLDRYLAESSPGNGARFHFTDDPVVFHFKHDHVTNLIERYDREWDIELRRTDPEPKAGGVPGLAEAPLLGVLQTLLMPEPLLSPYETAIQVALEDAPCIESERVVGGTTLAGTFPLEPDVMYDANLWAAKTGTPSDRIQVTAANFRTSRYANPVQMVEALGLDTSGTVNPSPIDELILDASANLPASVLPASDRDFDAAMVDLGLDTLGLPPDGVPRVFALWQPVGNKMTLQAIMIDALEPMNRTAHVISGTGVEIAERVRLNQGHIGARSLEVRRLNLNSTRALLVPTAPLPLNWAGDSFRVEFVTDGPAVVGRRQLRTQPLVLELEGF